MGGLYIITHHPQEDALRWAIKKRPQAPLHRIWIFAIDEFLRQGTRERHFP